MGYSNISYLENLLGEERTEEALELYIKGRLGEKTPKVKLGRRAKQIANETFGKGRGTNQASRRGEKFIRWTEEERVEVLSQAEKIFQETNNWASVARELSKTTGRTVSSLFNFLYNSGITKKYATK